MHHLNRDALPPLPLGKLIITKQAEAALGQAKAQGVSLLHRHLRGDWGDVTELDTLQNELALLLGLRVCSSYLLRTGQTIWVITAANRSTTQIMLADSALSTVSDG